MVGVVASAGGVEALSHFVAALPADLPAAVLVVLHTSPTGPSVLPRILSRAGQLPARHAVNGQALKAGEILVAPPDQHLAAIDGHVELQRGPRRNGHRPSADVLLTSVARTEGERGAGVVLSGTMDDGAAGLVAVGSVGGLTLVQEPEEAAFPGMPRAAIEEARPEMVAPVAALARRVVRWATQLESEKEEPEEIMADPDPADLTGGWGDELVPLTCPECGGNLWSHDEFGAQRLRCRVGHTFSADALLMGKKDAVEAAIWAAIVALEEQSELYRRMVKRSRRANGPGGLHERYEARIDHNEQRVAMLHRLIDELVGAQDAIYESDHPDA